MSQENVELVTRLYDLWNRGDIDAAMEMTFMGLRLCAGLATPK